METTGPQRGGGVRGEPAATTQHPGAGADGGLDEPSAHLPPEPPRETGATASERASAQVAAELSGRDAGGPEAPAAE